MMKGMKNKTKAGRRRHRFVPDEVVTGVMETTLPGVPADFLFQQLRNMRFFGNAVDEIQSIERYDGVPTLVYNVDSSPNNQEKRASLAKPGHCYLQRRLFSGQTMEIRSQFTRVDDEYNAEHKKTFIMVCSFLHSITTSTYVIEQLPPEKLLQSPPTTSKSRSMTSTSSSSESSSSSSRVSTTEVPCNDDGTGGGCRWTLSYAMVPDGWRGRLSFWRRGKRQLQKELHKISLDELEQLKKAVQASYYSIGSSTNEVLSCCTVTA